MLSKIRTHGLEHLGQNRGRGVVVEVNAMHADSRFNSTCGMRILRLRRREIFSHGFAEH